ncbi:hypothetical protein BLA24_18125 [Streptomyces cinnamoneus]|uniref:Uncharacterized protein n=2 Tax=Streptomyces cinnamoneus TaxID=53446 RepID=A0A2G1XHH9_STRCJ|nr:hypothetical protein BLA24_18125 [Streptomyces cinnamoneus]
MASLVIAAAIRWPSLFLAPSDPQAQPAGRRRWKSPPRPGTPDLIVPPGKRSPGMNDALERVRKAAPEAVQHGPCGQRRFALIPRVREEISAVIEDHALAEAESRELRHAAQTCSTYVLGSHPPPVARRPGSLGRLVLHCAAGIVPGPARWQEEWASEYAAMSGYPLSARVRFLAGLLLAAPRLAWSLGRRPDR